VPPHRYAKDGDGTLRHADNRTPHGSCRRWANSSQARTRSRLNYTKMQECEVLSIASKSSKRPPLATNIFSSLKGTPLHTTPLINISDRPQLVTPRSRLQQGWLDLKAASILQILCDNACFLVRFSAPFAVKGSMHPERGRGRAGAEAGE
jgi:hypothetical protein